MCFDSPLYSTRPKKLQFFAEIFISFILIYSWYYIDVSVSFNVSTSSTDTTYYGLFYSSGWPNGYTNGSGVCYHTVSLPKGKQARIAVMDLDLRKVKSTCDGGNDYFQMRGL